MRIDVDTLNWEIKTDVLVRFMSLYLIFHINLNNLYKNFLFERKFYITICALERRIFWHKNFAELLSTLKVIVASRFRLKQQFFTYRAITRRKHRFGIRARETIVVE